MKSTLLPASRIAELVGVSRQYVSGFVKKNCEDAKSGTKININHPVMVQFFKDKNVDLSDGIKSASDRTHHLAKKPVSQSSSKLSAGAKPQIESEEKELPADLRDLAVSEHGNLTLTQLAAVFGDDEQYRGWLDAKKKQVEIREREIKVEAVYGRYILKEVVEKGMIGLVDGFTSRLLTDFCKSTPIDLRAAFESGKDNIQIEQLLRELISKQLDPVIKTVAEQLSD